MSEVAQDNFERHEHLAKHPEDSHGRRAALLIGVLAAVLALCEMEERSAQNAYLAHHVGASDEYAFYQARETRALMLTQSAAILDALPVSKLAADSAAAARAEAARLTADSDKGNGLQQIQARAGTQTRARDIALHRTEWFEVVTSALQIAIVLASVSVVTGLRTVARVGAVLGLAAAALAVTVAIGVV